MTRQALLTIKNLARQFGTATVLESVSLTLQPGEVLALVGENGAGKSTLMKIIGGYLPPSSGSVSLNGGPGPTDMRQAEARGVVMVHQEFALIPDMSVAENIFLGRETCNGPFVDRRHGERQAVEALALLGRRLNPGARLKDLPVSDWQMIELAKAFARGPRLLLMDEPTAVLSSTEAHYLFERIRAFRNAGGAVIFTSHRLDEVKTVADRVAVLRDGHIVRTEAADAISEDEMAASMVGRPLSNLYPAKSPAPAPDAPPLLRVEGLEVPGVLEPAVKNVELEVRRGEILGIAGLVGSGRTELCEGLLGLRKASCRRFELRGQARKLPSTREAWQQGLAYLTEDRKGKGLLLNASLPLNLSLTRGALRGRTFLRPVEEIRAYDSARATYDIRAANPDTVAGLLSGGNQQKLLIAKTLATDPELVVFDEPTRGVDIGAKQQIYQLIVELAGTGKAVVVISSEMQEVIGLSHRALVMKGGEISGELTGDDITEDNIIRCAMGLDEFPSQSASTAESSHVQ